MTTVLQHWVGMLREIKLPVLAHTANQLTVLQQAGDAATPKRISQVVLHDPLMTVQVLQYLQQHRSRHRTADITTIAHALMMLGTTPFFAHFVGHSTIEARLSGAGDALDGLRKVMSRARHAALYAQDWAQRRHDVDPQEIMIAALLHDIAEMMLWCYAPALALEIAGTQQLDRTLRSEDVQRDVIGFRLLDLQLELIAAWQLPALLRNLMDETRTQNPRVQIVARAAAVARHSAHGWDNLALPYDYERISELLNISCDEAAERVAAVAREADADWTWYGVPPLERKPVAEAANFF